MRQLNLLNNQLTHSTLQLYIRRRWWWWKLGIINKPMTLVFETFCHDNDFVNRTWLWAPFIRGGWYSSWRVLKRKEVKLQTAYSFTLRYCKKKLFSIFFKGPRGCRSLEINCYAFRGGNPFFVVVILIYLTENLDFFVCLFVPWTIKNFIYQLTRQLFLYHSNLTLSFLRDKV